MRGKKHGLIQKPRMSQGHLAGYSELSPQSIVHHLPKFYKEPEKLISFLYENDWNEYWPGLNKALQDKRHWQMLPMADILIKTHYAHLVRHGDGGWLLSNNNPMPKTLENFWSYSNDGLWLTSEHFTLANIYPSLNAYLNAWKKDVCKIATPHVGLSFVECINNLLSDAHYKMSGSDTFPKATNEIFTFWHDILQTQGSLKPEYITRTMNCLVGALKSNQSFNNNPMSLNLLGDDALDAITNIIYMLIKEVDKNPSFFDSFNREDGDEWNEKMDLLTNNLLTDRALGKTLQAYKKEVNSSAW